MRDYFIERNEDTNCRTPACSRRTSETQFPTLQVEGTSLPIVLGRASKIPPIYEGQTASNISFEEGGVLNLPKPCNRQPLLSSVSRGVRSRPQEENAASVKVETVPLLSPTMELELLKEPWIFPQPKANLTREEDSSIVSAWEENFQDLSGWCMDTFQSQCDFHIGESTNSKLSGTKYEGNSVLSSEEGVFKDLTSVTDEEKWSMKMNSTGIPNQSSNSGRTIESTSEASTRYIKGDTTTDIDTSNLWVKIPKGAATNTNGISWGRQNGADLNVAFHTKHRVDKLDIDEACPTSFDSTDIQHEAWDVLRTVETTGSDEFDLLSYLCDDEARSPDGSVSTDSSTISRPQPIPEPTGLRHEDNAVQVKVESDEPLRPKMETRGTCTVTSTSLETPTINTRKTERTRTIASSKVEKTYSRARRERQEKRRYTESDSDDRMSLSHYRESREKNNEASRKSRMNKKAKETEMAMRAIELERDNRILKMKVEELEKLVTSMRSALLRSALKKEF